MRKQFRELEERLLRAGVSPRHVRRYVAELTDHLADLRAEEERAAGRGTGAEAAAVARLGSEDELAAAMLGRGELRSCSARAPWAVFGLGGLLSLGILYFVACSILWSGWRIFLPGSPTPFVRLEGLAVPYFGMGRLIYYGAPVFVGWGLGVIAARQRMKAVWPVAGIVLACVAGAMAQVRVGAVGSVGLVIAPFSVTYLAWLMVVAALPYLVWRVVE
jgi:hypothetical protein